MIQHQPFSEYAVQFSISCQSFKEIHLKIALKKLSTIHYHSYHQQKLYPTF